jgi:hypothetical protein
MRGLRELRFQPEPRNRSGDPRTYFSHKAAKATCFGFFVPWFPGIKVLLGFFFLLKQGFQVHSLFKDGFKQVSHFFNPVYGIEHIIIGNFHPLFYLVPMQGH